MKDNTSKPTDSASTSKKVKKKVKNTKIPTNLLQDDDDAMDSHIIIIK